MARLIATPAEAQAARVPVVVEAELEGEAARYAATDGDAAGEGAVGGEAMVGGVMVRQESGIPGCHAEDVAVGIGLDREPGLIRDDEGAVEVGRVLARVTDTRRHEPVASDRLPPLELEGVHVEAPVVVAQRVAERRRGLDRGQIV